MKISIITINYNNIVGLKKTVESVICQSGFKSIEYIIIDGGSTDGTVDFLKTLPHNIIWLSEKDRGISHAFNKGVQLSTGDAILCLNSGDFFVNTEVVSKVIADWEKCNVDILSYKVRVTDGKYIPSTNIPDKIYNTCIEPHQGTFVSKKIYQKIGIYSEEFKIRMDFHFFARCLKAGASFKFIDEIIVNYEEGGTSMKPENRIRFWKEGMAIKFLYGVKLELKDLCKILIWF